MTRIVEDLDGGTFTVTATAPIPAATLCRICRNPVTDRTICRDCLYGRRDDESEEETEEHEPDDLF